MIRIKGNTMKRKKCLMMVILLCMGVLAGCGSRKEKEATEPEKNGQKTEATDGTRPEELKIVTAEEPELEDTENGESTENSEEENDGGKVRNPEKKGILIALDPGHQGPNVDMSAQEPNAPDSSVMKTKATGGTSGRFTGIPEYQLNLDIALMVRDRLTEQGYDVIMTREDNDTAISNAERASLANDVGADISVRIHANGSESSLANGALVLIGSASNPYVGELYESSSRLAETVLNAYCASTGMQNLGIQANDTMTGINWSKIPVIILEMGFMTNEQDDRNMADASYREKMAEGIVNGINAYYGVVQ